MDYNSAMRTLVVAMALIACAPSKPPCTEASVSALRELYTHAARDVIESGVCDSIQKVEDCPQYRAIELHFEVASVAMCGGAL